MKNNAMHYKMYKAKKNIVYAGLVTTAMLAGLTLTNVNNNVNAATTDTVATAQTASANPDVQSAQAAVSAASNQVTSAQAAVSDANAEIASAQNLNSDYAAVTSAQDAYKEALNNRSDVNKTWASADAAYNQASDAASAAISNAAAQAGFSTTDSQAAQKAVAYWNAISNQASDTLASVAAARPAVEDKLAQAKEDYAIQSNYVADLATRVNNLKSEASAQSAASNAAWTTTSAAASDLEKKFNSAAYDLNTNYTYKMNSAQTDVDYLNNKTLAANKDQNIAKDATTKLASFLTAKANNEIARQNAVAAQALVNKAEKAYTDAMDTYNLPNSQALSDLNEAAATNKNWAKKYQDQLNTNTVYSDAKSDLDRANSAQAKAQGDVKTYTENVASDNAAVSAASDALSAANEQVANAKTEAEKNAAYAAKANAEDALSRAQAQLTVNSAALTSANTALRNANRLVKTATTTYNNMLKQNVTVDEGLGANNPSMTFQEFVNLVNDWNAKAKASTEKLNAANENLAKVKDIQATIDKAQAKLAQAKDDLAAAQTAYQNALDALNALNPTTPTDPTDPKPVDPSNPSTPSTPGEDSTPVDPDDPTNPSNPSTPGEDSTPSTPDESAPVDPTNPSTPDESAPVDPTNPSTPDESTPDESGVTPSTPDESTPGESTPDASQPVDDNNGNGDQGNNGNNNGANGDQGNAGNNNGANGNQGNNNGANGNQGNAGNNNGANGNQGNNNGANGNQGNAGNNNAANGNHVNTVNKDVAKTPAKAEAANELPQTGNENTAAVVALGAVSAMFGLSLAAKKREF